MCRRTKRIVVGLLFGVAMVAGQAPVLPEVAKAPMVGARQAPAAMPVVATPVAPAHASVARPAPDALKVPSVPEPKVGAPAVSVAPMEVKKHHDGVKEHAGKEPREERATVPAVVRATSVEQPARAVPVVPVAPSATQGATPVVSSEPVGMTSKEAAPTVDTSAPVDSQAPAARDEKSTVASSDEEISGIDTVDIEEPEGNWLFKRLWFEKAEDRFDKVREHVGQVTNLYEGFLVKRTALDHDLFDQFNKTTGFARGELEEVLSYLMERVEDMRAKKGALQENEREFFTMLQSEQENLKKLQLDIEAINKIDLKIDEAIKKLTELLNKCRTWEGQSWQNLRQIARELSHTKAKNLFRDILTYENNIVAVADYVEKPFTEYFDKQAQIAREQVARVEQNLKSMKERGLDFAKQAEALGLRERAQKAATEQEEVSAKPTTFWGYVVATPKALWRFGKNVVTAIWQQTKDSISALWSMITGLFSEKPVEQTASMPAMPVTRPVLAPELAPIKP